MYESSTHSHTTVKQFVLSVSSNQTGDSCRSVVVDAAVVGCVCFEACDEDEL